MDTSFLKLKSTTFFHAFLHPALPIKSDRVMFVERFTLRLCQSEVCSSQVFSSPWACSLAGTFRAACNQWTLSGNGKLGSDGETHAREQKVQKARGTVLHIRFT